MDLITTHINTDFDGLAAMIAAKKLYPGAQAAMPGAQERTVREFMRSSAWAFDIKKPSEVDLSKVRRLILVDTRDARRIGPFSALLEHPGLDVHIYDHHPLREGDLRGSVEVVEEVGCVSTLMVELLQSRQITITPVEATAMALGIYEETGFFSFPSTGERDFLAMAYLLKQGANLNVVKTFLEREPSREQLGLLNDLLESAREYEVSGFLVQIAQASRDEYIPDAAMVTHKLRDILDCDALFVLLRMEDRIHVIGRSRVAEIDVAEILRHFEGGGHTYASSAVVKGNSLEGLEESLRGLLEKGVRPVKRAADIMTSPVKCIEHSASLKQAQESMSKFGFNVMPVLKGGKFFGVISREVVERALHHGFGNRHLSSFATTDPVTAAPDTSMLEVEGLMVERNRKFLPVLEDGRVVGAITRTDLLRVLYEDLIRRTRTEGEDTTERVGSTRNIRSAIIEKLPSPLVDLLRLCGHVGDRMAFQVYLVGGSVRDLLRNERNLDLDLVVEGQGIAFARELASELGGRVRSHQRFNTAVVILPDGFKLDVATARTEYYEAPGVLPTVEASSIKKDLYRRDFTINTLAVKLNGQHFGVLLDFFGGQRDLKDRTIRILHNLSFVEDPTRAFRAIRFAVRFGFRIGKHTANLMKNAVRMNLMEKVSGSRLYDELLLMFSETSPAKSVRELSRYSLLQSIHPSIRYRPSLQDLLERLEKVIAWYRLLYLPDPLNESDLWFMALLFDLRELETVSAFEQIAVPEKVAERIARFIGQTKAVHYRLKTRPHSSREVFHALSDFDLEPLVFGMAATQDESLKKALATFITDLRKTRPLLSGKELIAMGYEPGPWFHEVFQALLDARLEGKVRTKYEETRFVRERFPNTSISRSK